MRIGLLTEGGYPYATGDSGLWCDRLVRGLPQHEFDLFALSRSAHQEGQGWVRLPHQVGRVRTAPLWAPDDVALRGSGERGLPARLVTGGEQSYGRRDRRRFAACLAALAAAVCTPDGPGAEVGAVPGAELFAEGLYGFAELARERGGLPSALRSEAAVRLLEAASRARGAGRTVRSATVPDLLAFAAELERALRPLSLDWYDEESLGAVDLCHAASGGAAALPGLLAKRFFGVPLLVTEHGVPLRAHHLTASDSAYGAPVRALLARCEALAAQLFPCEGPRRDGGGASGGGAEGLRAVTFEEVGGPDGPGLAEAYGAGGVIVLSSTVEGFPVGLVEAMFCGRATVSTDVGAVVEVVGGTGLVVPPRDPGALADACVALLRDPARRARLGAAAHARARELFTVEQNLAAFRGIYLELMSHAPVRREADTVDAHGGPLPFAVPLEARLPGPWARSGAHLREGGTGEARGPGPAAFAAARRPAAADGVRSPDRPGEPGPRHTREPEPEGLCAVAAGPTGSGDA
ncbi:DUF3492 domain-containing protein [Streptomyces sp. DH8]|uniref:DUF3492 domain-containing protein n=1 Tax=Streptomyces sp. DH8 TaxID=2857008 RepID=UPI001E2A6F40|nr:DUF3492 domain-containing protein [Streptomyces sp. DH8]